MLAIAFWIGLGVVIGLLAAPYTGVDEWLQRKMTKRVIDELRDEGVIE